MGLFISFVMTGFLYHPIVKEERGNVTIIDYILIAAAIALIIYVNSDIGNCSKVVSTPKRGCCVWNSPDSLIMKWRVELERLLCHHHL